MKTLLLVYTDNFQGCGRCVYFFAVWCCALLCGTVLYWAVLCSAVRCSTVQCGAHCTVGVQTAPNRTALSRLETNDPGPHGAVRVLNELVRF